MADSVNFTGNCGECNHKGSYYTATSATPQQLEQPATVNGRDPQYCIVGNDGAAVYSFKPVRSAGIYAYKVDVDAQGPSGTFSGSFYLAFKDASGDVYPLKITSSKREHHSVGYNSSSPAIVQVYWSDYDFTVKE